MTGKWTRLLAVCGVLALALAACSSSSSSKSTSDTKASTTTTKAAAGQTLTITPDKNLTNNQTVHLVGSGFTPGNSSLGANECADKGNDTGAGDCNLGGTITLKADAQGKIEADFVVLQGPFGQNQIVCSATVKCLISVSELVQSPKEVATAPLNFAS